MSIKENLPEVKRKRFFKNKTTMILSISLILACSVTGLFGVLLIQANSRNRNLSRDYDILYADYQELLNDYQILIGDYDSLFNDYNNLLNDYNSLSENYDILLGLYNALQSAYDSVCDTIKQSILPVQYCILELLLINYWCS